MTITEFIQHKSEEENKFLQFIGVFAPLTSTLDCLNNDNEDYYVNPIIKFEEGNRFIICVKNIEEEYYFLFLDTPDKVVVYKFAEQEEESNNNDIIEEK